MNRAQLMLLFDKSADAAVRRKILLDDAAAHELSSDAAELFYKLAEETVQRSQSLEEDGWAFRELKLEVERTHAGIEISKRDSALRKKIKKK